MANEYRPLDERNKTIVIDFETRSAADIRDVGADKYAEHRTTEVLCLAYTLGQSKQTKILTPASGSTLTKADEQPLWVRERYWEKGYVIEAWNVGFEIAIWRNVCVSKLGWPDIPDEYWRDTMLQAAVCALPLSLGGCGAALQLDVQKDEEGKSVMMKLSRPRSQNEDGTWEFYERPAPEDYLKLRSNGRPLTKAQVNALDKVAHDFEVLYNYCVDDVRSEREIMYALPPVTDTELKHWQHTMLINKRGVHVDEAVVDTAIKMIREYEEYQNEIVEKVTAGAVLKASNVAGIKAWMETFGVFTDSVDKAHVIELLKRANLPDPVKKVLEIRQALGKASTTKLKKFKATLCRDNRFHNALRHHGATTGRFTSVGSVQTQNLPRGDLSIEQIEAVFTILRRGGSWKELCGFGNPMDVLSSCLRAFIIPKPGCRFLSADFANIEGRGVAWLSSEESKLEKFRAFDNGVGEDIYKSTAAGILNKSIADITKEERQAYGKVPELACLAPETQILTNKGYCTILDLSTDHLVWDGVEFVKHEGVICKGMKQVINLNGVRLTPNHKVLVGSFWVEARQLASSLNTQLRALETGSESLPYVDLNLGKRVVAKSALFSETLVYDIVNAGPRNRFTIKTKDGGHLIVHNCGYMGGAGAFKAMAKTYGVQLADDEISSIVKGWRDIHPNIMSFGYQNYNVVMQVIRTGNPSTIGPITHYLEDLFLCTRLPSGRVIRYAYPRIERVTTPWGEEKLGITFMTMKKPQNAHKEVVLDTDDDIGDAKWIRIQASPGLLTENYTQAIARDIMVEAAYRCEFEYGYPITMSIHDELVAEVPEGHGSLEEFERVMAQNPEWAPDLPIACEGWEGYFYRK